jgi:hypothetical protein
MSQVIEIIKAQYDTLEVPFGRSYRWHQAHVVFECDCGERPTFKSSALTGSRALCVCGVDLTSDIQEKLQGHQPAVHGQLLEDDEATRHPWLHDSRVQAEQHIRDEAAYPEGSPWRYNDITSRGTDNERSAQYRRTLI